VCQPPDVPGGFSPQFQNVNSISCVSEKTGSFNVHTLPPFKGGEVIECKELKKSDIYVSSVLSPVGVCVDNNVFPCVDNISINAEFVLNSIKNDCVYMFENGKFNLNFDCNHDDIYQYTNKIVIFPLSPCDDSIPCHASLGKHSKVKPPLFHNKTVYSQCVSGQCANLIEFNDYFCQNVACNEGILETTSHIDLNVYTFEIVDFNNTKSPYPGRVHPLFEVLNCNQNVCSSCYNEMDFNVGQILSLTKFNTYNSCIFSCCICALRSLTPLHLHWLQAPGPARVGTYFFSPSFPHCTT
jgi:hypothetical protein